MALRHASQRPIGTVPRRWRRFSGAVLTGLSLAAAPSLAEDRDAEADDRGLTEYEIACMSCHGVEGRGDGPAAAALTMPPADLTQIAKGNGGVFPTQRVTDMIDGRAAVKSHGRRDMPVWGARYRVSIDPDDKVRDADKRARELIAALVDYLKSIQI